jgi:hypothetical protein
MVLGEMPLLPASDNRRRRADPAVPWVAVALFIHGVIVPGCAGPVAQRPRHASGLAAGRTAVMAAPVLAPPLPAGGILDEWAAAEDLARRDDDLSVRSPDPILASAEWPQPALPTLSDRRYLWLPTDGRQMMYLDAANGRWQAGPGLGPGGRGHRRY